MISPVLMGGTVKELRDGQVKVHLHGRLGVLTVPRRLVIEQERLAVGAEAKFFFSYLWIAPHRGDYETAAMNPAEEIFPAYDTLLYLGLCYVGKGDAEKVGEGVESWN